MTDHKDEKLKRQIQAAKQVMSRYDSVFKKLAETPIDHAGAAANPPPKKPKPPAGPGRS